MARKRQRNARVGVIAGLAVLGIAAAGVAGFAVLRPTPPPPVSEKVANYSATPLPTKAAPVKVASIGDSYSAGSGATNLDLGWVQQLGRNQAWQLQNFARGGTGYVAGTKDPVKAKDACNREACPSYGEMIAEAKTFGPEVVIVSGGRNDYAIETEDEVTAIKGFYASLRQELPNAKIVAFSPLWDDDPAPASIPAIATAVKESVTAVGGVYLDSGQPLQGKPELLASDSKHPNDAGYKVLFEKNLSLLQQAGIAAK